MPIATIVDIIEHTGLEPDVAQKAERKLPLASQRVRKLVGDLYYEALEAAAEGGEQYERRQRVVQAECLLAYADALPELNLRLTEKGGLVRSTGYGESRQSLMSKRELDDYRLDLTAQAKALISDLILASNGVWAL